MIQEGVGDAMKRIASRRPGRNKLVYDKLRQAIVVVPTVEYGGDEDPRKGRVVLSLRGEESNQI